MRTARGLCRDLRLLRDWGQMGHAYRKETGQTPRLLGARAPVAADRGVRDGRRAVLDGARGLDADVPGIGGNACAGRSSARPGVPAIMAAGLAPLGLGDGCGAGRCDGAAGGGTVRPARDSRLCGRSQPPGLDGLVGACGAELKTAEGGPAAQQGGVKPSPRPADGRQYVFPAGGRTAARARRAGGSAYQLVYLVIGDASSMISTSSRESFAKARHMATSSQESRGPCSTPVASSTTI